MKLFEFSPGPRISGRNRAGVEHRAIILAAGRGRRLLPVTSRTPKSLVDIGGSTIFYQQLAALHECGIHDILVVTGFQATRFRQCGGEGVRYVNNDRYDDTNSAYSLWLARAALDRPCLILNADVLFCHSVLERLMSHPFPDAIAYDSGSTMADEETKVQVGYHGKLADIGKNLDPARADGEHLGLIRLSLSGAELLAKALDTAIVDHGDESMWVPQVLRTQIEQRPVFGVDVNGLPWIEVDFVEDLVRAREVVFPALTGRKMAR